MPYKIPHTCFTIVQTNTADTLKTKVTRLPNMLGGSVTRLSRSVELRTHSALRPRGLQRANWPRKDLCQRSHAHGFLLYDVTNMCLDTSVHMYDLPANSSVGHDDTYEGSHNCCVGRTLKYACILNDWIDKTGTKMVWEYIGSGQMSWILSVMNRLRMHQTATGSLVTIIATLRWVSCGPGSSLQTHPLKSQ